MTKDFIEKKMPDTLENITNLTLTQLHDTMQEMGQPLFRYSQILKWLYKKRVSSYDEMKNIPLVVRNKLKIKYSIQKFSIRYLLESKKGGAVKFGLESGRERDVVESVLLYSEKRRSLCISSQLGCAFGCLFCETGKMGFIRDLTQSEIIGQLISANDYLADHSDKPVTNVIFMGMGEALSNFDNFLSTLEIIMDDNCFGIGGRKITVSTAGVIPSIEKLMSKKLNINLAISLNSYNNEKRNAIMPINRKYPIEDLVKSAAAYHRSNGKRITFEYVVMEHENDTEEASKALTELLKNVPCKINLIPLNPYSGKDLSAPTEIGLNRFAGRLAQNGLTVTVRKSIGLDISGACGQLAGKIR